MCLESGGKIYNIMQSEFKKVRGLHYLCIKWAMLFPAMHECVILLIKLSGWETEGGDCSGTKWYENSYNFLSRFKEAIYEFSQPEIPMKSPLFPPKLKAPR